MPIAVRTENAARRTANFYVLNTTAELLWERLETPADVEELTRQLAVHYEISAEDARRDVEQFLIELERCGAIITAEPN